MDGLRSAPQDDGVPRLQAQRRGVGGDVRPRFVDDPDDAEGDAHAADQKAVGTPPHAGDLAHRIGEGRHLAEAPGDPRKRLLRQGQAVDHGRGQALLACRFEVPGVFRDQGRLPGQQRVGHRDQGRILPVGGDMGQAVGGLPRLPGDSNDLVVEIHERVLCAPFAARSGSGGPVPNRSRRAADPLYKTPFPMSRPIAAADRGCKGEACQVPAGLLRSRPTGMAETGGEDRDGFSANQGGTEGV